MVMVHRLWFNGATTNFTMLNVCECETVQISIDVK